MLSNELPRQISLLVDHLRKTDRQDLTLSDIAGVSEVLIRTMSAFFKSIDTTIYRECRALRDYIENARVEIANLQPVDLESDRIPRAGLELAAIVEHTEEATNTIMEAAEEIMGADPADAEAFTSVTQDAVMRIFEACSFQDITGQRISKVVQTLEHIEERVLSLRDLMGVTESHMRQDEELDPEKALLSGPALEGEGIGQSDVDALLGGDGNSTQSAAPTPAGPEVAPAPIAKAAPPAKPAPPPKPEAVDPAQLDAMFEEDFDVNEAPGDDAADVKAAPEPAPEPKPEPVPEPAAAGKPEKKDDTGLKAGGEVSQDDIDALFG